jgi:FPC/CPF motif-containing protein YcgG
MSITDFSTICLPESAITEEISRLIRQKNYPCIAALRALELGEMRGGFFSAFGSGEAGRALRAQLGLFLREQSQNGSEYLTFWAFFDPAPALSEEAFEAALWRELSALTSEEERGADWGAHPADPAKRSFSFCLFGEPFFVVGLHPASSRPGRRFSRPALVFNVFRQFEALEKKGAYDPMVRTNRRRDVKFSGQVNPMAEKYGDEWEAIQFSGKENSAAWRCPFHFLRKGKS